jgi:type I restriction enzyme, S subunit
MVGWSRRPLSDFVDPDRSICYGIVQPGSPVADGVPIVRVNNFTGGGVDTADALKVDAEIEAKYRRSRLQGGELLITLVGSMGLSAIAPDELRGWNVARAVGVVPLRPDADKRWINFVVRSQPSQDFIRLRANTTVQATFNLKDLAELPVPCPPDPVREEMSAILSALDDKIELNRRMNETLEAMSRAIFKDWFVDFGPTCAKMEGRAPYLAPDIWSLFPDRLDDEGKPEGWSVGFLSTIAMLNPESWSRSNYPDRVNYVDLSNTKWGTIEAVTQFTSEAAPSRAQRILRPGDTVVGTVRPGNGSYAFVSGDDLTGSTGFAVLRPIQDIYREAVYLAVTSKDNIDRLAHLADGGAYPAVRPELVAATELICASEGVFSAFSSATGGLIDRAEANKRENRTLATTRDFLLPKLMSGEVRVKDAEKLVGEAV